MASLSDIRSSITALPKEEGLSLIARARTERRKPGRTSQRAASIKKNNIERTVADISPEMAAMLLAALGEDED